ncbi:unnamed protein product [Caenorhabditis sp. 36 PRJEB53466]|nr:unnamed protein product [Caenorhabditis sp. 36 PRJEB53466]
MIQPQLKKEPSFYRKWQDQPALTLSELHNLRYRGEPITFCVAFDVHSKKDPAELNRGTASFFAMGRSILEKYAMKMKSFYLTYKCKTMEWCVFSAMMGHSHLKTLEFNALLFQRHLPALTTVLNSSTCTLNTSSRNSVSQYKRVQAVPGHSAQPRAESRDPLSKRNQQQTRRASRSAVFGSHQTPEVGPIGLQQTRRQDSHHGHGASRVNPTNLGCPATKG